MHKKLVIYRLTVDVETISTEIAAATSLSPSFKSFADDVKAMLFELGYKLADPGLPESARTHACSNNDGVSVYYTFYLQKEDYTIQLVLDVRFSNHPVKSHHGIDGYAKHKENMQRDAVPKVLEETGRPASDDPDIDFASIEQPDVPYWNITIGKDTKPIHDPNVALMLLENKFRALRDKER